MGIIEKFKNPRFFYKINSDHKVRWRAVGPGWEVGLPLLLEPASSKHCTHRGDVKR